MSSRKSSKSIWIVRSTSGGAVSIQAANRSFACRQDLSTKNTKCTSRWVGLDNNSSVWKLKRYRSLSGYEYVVKSVKRTSAGGKCPLQVLSLPTSTCSKFRPLLGKDTKSERSRSKWQFISAKEATPSPPFSPVESPSPPPPVSPRPSPPPPVNRRCANRTPVYSHYDYDTSPAIRQVCEALWDTPEEYNLIFSGIGKQITCRADTYESPRPTEWASPRPPVCALLQQVASSDERFDIGDDLADPCGLWFWCSNPAVDDEGLIVMQWNIQLKTTYGQ
ncbi:hypothetical protein M9434_005024 [Picochlorum sp. BPE23]|nr:hypothetical protein M9434_005024 [Picochlorum sp. BPE23]